MFIMVEIKDILLIERSQYLGGILNQCIHTGFGVNYFNEVLTGPEYAERVVEEFNAISGGDTIYSETDQFTHFGYGTVYTNWLDVIYNGNILAPSQNLPLTLRFDTRELLPGDQFADISLFSNDTNNVLPEFQVTLHVNEPNNDLALTQIVTPGSSIHPLAGRQIGVVVQNIGTLDAVNRQLNFSVPAAGYSENLIINQLPAGRDTLIFLNSQWAENTFTANRVSFSIDANDDNSENNTISG